MERNSFCCHTLFSKKVQRRVHLFIGFSLYLLSKWSDLIKAVLEKKTPADCNTSYPLCFVLPSSTPTLISPALHSVNVSLLLWISSHLVLSPHFITSLSSGWGSSHLMCSDRRGGVDATGSIHRLFWLFTWYFLCPLEFNMTWHCWKPNQYPCSSCVYDNWKLVCHQLNRAKC